MNYLLIVKVPLELKTSWCLFTTEYFVTSVKNKLNIRDLPLSFVIHPFIKYMVITDLTSFIKMFSLNPSQIRGSFVF